MERADADFFQSLTELAHVLSLPSNEREKAFDVAHYARDAGVPTLEQVARRYESRDDSERDIAAFLGLEYISNEDAVDILRRRIEWKL